ncbi:LCP family protein [Actinomyces bowdenii]|uniref:LCP family protein n=1 Tax=Actinomyces bowdenii TaxID=131109 RepID=UPI001FD1348C|nr:LCP family protein [Actinomyces bowdenii]
MTPATTDPQEPTDDDASAPGRAAGRDPEAPDSREGRRRTLRAVLLSAAMVVLVVALVVAGLGLWLRHSLGSDLETIADPFAGIATRAPHQRVEGDQQPATNILVLGSDSRISAGDPSQWEAGAQRTDALMIMQISGDRQDISVVSIPRDTWVDIPGHGQAKINAAYAYGGTSLTIQTVEALTGIRIHHVAIADFESFTTLTDEIGGVTIDLKEPQTLAGTEFQAGPQQLNGAQALAYARERDSLPEGDFDRVKRQQAWMRAIVKQVFSSGALSSPTRLYSLLRTATRTVAVDDSFTLDEMQSLAWQTRDLRSGDIHFMTAPASGTATSPDGQSIVQLDQDRSQALFSAFAQDAVGEYLETAPDSIELLPATVN